MSGGENTSLLRPIAQLFNGNRQVPDRCRSRQTHGMSRRKLARRTGKLSFRSMRPLAAGRCTASWATIGLAAGEMRCLRHRVCNGVGDLRKASARRSECGPANKKLRCLTHPKGVVIMKRHAATTREVPRRGGLGLAVTVAALAGALAWSGTALAQTKTLKMQSTWPASLTLQDNFKMFAERVDKLTGGSLKIEVLAAGQIVPPFEILDATSKKVIDGGQGISYYWVGKNKAATLFSNTPAGIVGMDQMDFLGWLFEGGGLEMWQELYQKELKLNVFALPMMPASPRALGWFRKLIQGVEDVKGMKCRQTGFVAEVYKRMGTNTVNMPGCEIVPSAERGVIDCAEWVGGIEDLRLGLPQVWKYHYTPGPHEMSSVGEVIFNSEVWASFTPQQQEAVRATVNETFVR